MGKHEAGYHPYYNPRAAIMVADLIKEWKELGFKPTRISCNNVGINAPTLQAKIQNGMRWLADNATSAETKEFWGDLILRTKVTTHQNAVELRKVVREIKLVPLPETAPLDLRAEFNLWINDDPPSRAKWPLKSIPVELNDDDIAWFTARLAELNAAGIEVIGKVTPNSIVVVRMPPQLKII